MHRRTVNYLKPTPMEISESHGDDETSLDDVFDLYNSILEERHDHLLSSSTPCASPKTAGTMKSDMGLDSTDDCQDPWSCSLSKSLPSRCTSRPTLSETTFQADGVGMIMSSTKRFPKSTFQQRKTKRKSDCDEAASPSTVTDRLGAFSFP